MRKTVGKPQNWQDFETLCKKLWGEVWLIPHTIKKNGRAGQPQSGVDIYGKPKDRTNFYGIQCKGKDDYSQSVITIKEIEDEIEKAKMFQPPLELYIIATTANKDVKIEEYVRIRSLENINQGLFEILIFCWEDIVELMDEYPFIMDSYLSGINQRNRFGFKVSFNQLNDSIILRPKLVKEITKHIISNKTREEILHHHFFSRSFENNFRLGDPFMTPSRVNKSWVKFDLVMENVGNTVIEDFEFEVKFTEGVNSLISLTDILMQRINVTTYIDEKDMSIYYKPPLNHPIVQKSNKYFEVELLPKKTAKKITAECTLIARNFNDSGKFEIKIDPDFTEQIVVVELDSEASPRQDEISIKYLLE